MQRSDDAQRNGPGANTEAASVAQAIIKSREGMKLSIRELGRRTGISASQISRIEAGGVQRPAAETLVSLARGLDANPLPLLILSTHISERESRETLGRFLAEDSELADVWRSFGEEGQVESARTVLEDPESSFEAIADIAQDVFLTAETEETLWHDAYLALDSEQTDATELRELAAAWPSVSSERRQLVLQFVRDQVALSRREFVEELEREIEEEHDGKD